MRDTILKGTGKLVSNPNEHNFREVIPLESIPENEIAAGLDVSNVMVPIDLSRPNPDMMWIDSPVVRMDHAVRQKGPMATNKFYTNFYTDSQLFPSFTMPYVLTWVNGERRSKLLGMVANQPGQYKDDIATMFEPNVEGVDEWRAYIVRTSREDTVLGAVEFTKWVPSPEEI